MNISFRDESSKKSKKARSGSFLGRFTQKNVRVEQFAL
jgi:hypothetical protein